MKLSIVVPAINIEEELERAVKAIKKEIRGIDHEVLVIHDITELDKRKEIERNAAALKKKYGVKTIFRINQRGFGSALRMAFGETTGDVVVVMMADLCDDPKTLHKMLGKIDEGYDVVVGSRYMKGGGIIGMTTKERISRFVSLLMNTFTRVKCSDVANAFRAYRKEVLERVKTCSDSFDISIELIVKATKAGFRVSHVPTVWKNRDVGTSKFKVSGESKNYLKWFIYALITMPSALSLGLLALLIFAAAICIV